MPRKNTANKTSHRCKKNPFNFGIAHRNNDRKWQARMPPAPKTACKRNKSNRLPISMLPVVFSKTLLLCCSFGCSLQKYIRPQTCKNRQHGDTCNPYATRSRWPHHFSKCPKLSASDRKHRQNQKKQHYRKGQDRTEHFQKFCPDFQSVICRKTADAAAGKISIHIFCSGRRKHCATSANRQSKKNTSAKP